MHQTELFHEIASASRHPGEGARRGVLLSGPGGAAVAARIASLGGAQLLRIDLARVVSQYIGETEQNLARVFEDAERQGAILFIDEADALFERHSDAQALLHRIAKHSGLVILATQGVAPDDHPFQESLGRVVEVEVIADNIDAIEAVYFAYMLERM